jgi:OmpA-OmpF porin, OOP family
MAQSEHPVQVMVAWIVLISLRVCGYFFLSRRTMKKLNQLAMLFASAALASAAGAQTIDNWRATDGTVWKNGTNEYCWRDANWTPATAAATCDGAIAPKMAEKAAMAPPPAQPANPPVAAKPAETMAPKTADVAAKPATPPVAPPALPPVAATKVTYAADAFFDFNKAVLKPEGKAKLDDLTGKVKSVNLEVIIAVGHTDSVGSDAMNQKLSVKRAEAVKAYLVSKGIEKNRVYTEGKGKKQPVADNKTKEGMAKNRRVEIEVVGTRAKK